jgi:hypothetical protein
MTSMFKTCTFCNEQWPSRNNFLNDNNIIIIGYQASFDEQRPGIFLFNHSCKTTLSVRTDKFLDLYEGPVFLEQKTGSSECGGLCLNENNLTPCAAPCKYAHLREIIQIIKKHEKAS